MEEMWKKFKEETRDDLENIKEFLKQSSIVPLDKQPNMFQPKPLEKIEQEISNNIVLDDKSQFAIARDVSLPAGDMRKKTYGSLTEIVKQLMQNEQISRAQAYRKAKILAEKSQ